MRDEGLLRKLLKCSCQRLLSPSWSLIRVAPSDDSSGEQLDVKGPNTVLRELKNFLVLSVCVALNFSCFVLPPLVLHLPQDRLHFGLYLITHKNCNTFVAFSFLCK